MSDIETVAQDQLKSFVERIESLEEDKKSVADDIKDVYAEAKGNGFDTKVLRKIIAMRKMDQNDRAEQEATIEIYCQALGMNYQPSLPLAEEELRPRKRGKRANRTEAGEARP